MKEFILNPPPWMVVIFWLSLARYRMNRRLFFLLLVMSLALITGCGGPEPSLAIRIGLLADSQLTSPTCTPQSVYRNKDTDLTYEDSIRPPALEHLAEETLQVALDKLSEKDTQGKAVDVILYLGDGANSGGEDEIDRLFKVLTEHRERTGIPIFMVIGNHDYLGAGNVSNQAERMLLVNRIVAGEKPPLRYNRALSKYDVLQKISAFNSDPNYLSPKTMFTYRDNRESLDESLDHKELLYLAGHLVYAPGDDADHVEIFLADTSDYHNMPVKPELMKLAAYGWEGSISSNDTSGKNRISQIDCFFEKGWALESPDFRFIASHYHPDNLDRKRFLTQIPEDWVFELENMVHGIFEMADGFFGQRYSVRYLNSWLSRSGRNYWLSAHTHRKALTRPNQGKVHVGAILGMLIDASFHSLNIGSTTDYGAHVAIVEEYVKGKNIRLDKHVGYREIPVFDFNKRLLEDMSAAISEFGAAKRDDPIFHELEDMRNLEFGVSIVGLNKQYQKDYWLQKHTDASVKYLKEFIERFAGKHPEYERADVVACLAFIAGAIEEGKKPLTIAAKK